MIREWNKSGRSGSAAAFCTLPPDSESASRLGNYSNNVNRLEDILNDERKALYSDRKELESVRDRLQ